MVFFWLSHLCSRKMSSKILSAVFSPIPGRFGKLFDEKKSTRFTFPETNSKSPWKFPWFPSKYHQNGGFSMAMLVLGRVVVFSLCLATWWCSVWWCFFVVVVSECFFSCYFWKSQVFWRSMPFFLLDGLIDYMEGLDLTAGFCKPQKIYTLHGWIKNWKSLAQLWGHTTKLECAGDYTHYIDTHFPQNVLCLFIGFCGYDEFFSSRNFKGLCMTSSINTTAVVLQNFTQHFMHATLFEHKKTHRSSNKCLCPKHGNHPLNKCSVPHWSEKNYNTSPAWRKQFHGNP